MRAFLFVLLLSISLEQGIIKRSTRSKHGENCVSDSACEEGFICRRYRCMTTFESKNLKELGLLEKNICDLKRKCKTNEKCYKHRCVPINTPPDKPRERTMNQSDAHLVFAGSILLGKLPYLSGVKENNTFDYNHLFTHIQEYIKAADLAAVEQETVFHIPQQGKTFKKGISNTPKELGDAIANAGFKLVMHGSTYSYNKKDVGIINTLNFWKTNHPEVKTLGISATPQESENDYFIFTHEDLKFTTVKIEVSSTIFGDQTLTVPLNIENYHFSEKEFNEYIVDECMEKIVKILRRNKLKAYYGKPKYDRDYDDTGKLTTVYTEHYITDLYVDI